MAAASGVPQEFHRSGPGRWLFALCVALGGVLLAAASTTAGVLNASWTASTTRADGTALTNLAFYRIYAGTSSSPCPGSPFFDVTSPTPAPSPGQTVGFVLSGLSPGTLYHVAVTAVDGAGNESACSATASAIARSGGDGDFTGDGRADVAIHDEQTGDWYVGVSTGAAFSIEAWGTGFGNRGDAVEQVLTGDFTGDGKTDVAIHDRQTGDWYVGVSTGAGFRVEHWGSGFGNLGEAVEEVLVGDFTGDGKADVAIHDRQTGNWYVGASTGAAFAVEAWASRFGNRGDTVEEVFVGDFTGDGRTDVAIHDKQTGEWYVGVSTGAAFRIEAWGSGFGNRGDAVEQVLTGDFTGDGRTDVAIHDRQTGDWYVGVSTGAGLRVEHWGSGFGNRGEAVEEVAVGDFTGDGKTDVAIHDTQSGNWYLGISTGTGFGIEHWISGFGNRGAGVEATLGGDPGPPR